MSNVSLVLGPVLFQDFEIPEHIGFGGEQRLAVHELPGAGRVIDALGPRPTDITWSGIFSGPDATARALTLDALLAEGAILTLSWDVLSYAVVLRSFTAEYRNTAWVPYTLRCTVVIDPVLVLAGGIDSLLADVAADIASASGYAGQAGLDLGALQASTAAPGATVAGTSSMQVAGTALLAAQAGLQAGLLRAGSGIGAPVTNAAGVGALTSSCGNAALFSASAAFLGRAAANLLGGDA